MKRENIGASIVIWSGGGGGDGDGRFQNVRPGEEDDGRRDDGRRDNGR